MSDRKADREARRALALAAEPTLARIRADRKRVSKQIAPLLRHIEKNLYTERLNVNHLKEDCGVRNNSVAIFFHIEVGTPPGAYIAEGRLETAERLLEHTDLAIWRIADLVGYSGMPTFSRAFKRRYGVRPRAYRKSLRQEAEEAEKQRQREAVEVEAEPATAEDVRALAEEKDTGAASDADGAPPRSGGGNGAAGPAAGGSGDAPSGGGSTGGPSVRGETASGDGAAHHAQPSSPAASAAWM